MGERLSDEDLEMVLAWTETIEDDYPTGAASVRALVADAKEARAAAAASPQGDADAVTAVEVVVFQQSRVETQTANLVARSVVEALNDGRIPGYRLVPPGQHVVDGRIEEVE